MLKTMTDDFICAIPEQLIVASGEKAQSLLQGLLTCDIREVTATQSRLAAHCNPKGRVQISLRLFYFQERFHASLPEDMLDEALEQLNKYARLSRVKLEPYLQFSLLGCFGENLTKELARLVSDLPSAVDQVCSGVDWLVIKVPAAKPRFLLIAEQGKMQSWQSRLSQAFPLQGPDAWRQQNIEAGLAQVYTQTRDLFTPQMLNYPQLNAVSFQKGCYIGQEIIARTHYLGKVKRHLQQLSVMSSVIPRPGDKLWTVEDQEAGIVVDAVQKGAGECELLAVIQDTALSDAIFWHRDGVKVPILTCPPKNPTFPLPLAGFTK